MAWFGLDPWAEMYRMESQMNDLMDMIDYAQFVPTTGRHHRQQPRMSRQIQQQQASTPIASAPAKDTSADSAAAPKEGTAAEPQADKAPSSPTATTTAVTSTTPTSKAVQPREPEWESIWWPRTDLRETDAQYSVIMELPGVKKEDVAVDVSPDHVLTIMGKKDAVAENTGDRWHRVERSFGKFRRSFVIPEGVDHSAVAASFDNGVLTLTIPKPPAPPTPQNTKIEIH